MGVGCIGKGYSIVHWFAIFLVVSVLCAGYSVGFIFETILVRDTLSQAEYKDAVILSLGLFEGYKIHQKGSVFI